MNYVLLQLIVVLLVRANYAAARDKELQMLPELVSSQEMVDNAASSSLLKRILDCLFSVLGTWLGFGVHTLDTSDIEILHAFMAKLAKIATAEMISSDVALLQFSVILLVVS
ncbi:hypothetical protein Q3G72_002201 [Acer saccharum]|nr:hypothetical protein Q3G72_002201 [Acer saccharum]